MLPERIKGRETPKIKSQTVKNREAAESMKKNDFSYRKQSEKKEEIPINKDQHYSIDFRQETNQLNKQQAETTSKDPKRKIEEMLKERKQQKNNSNKYYESIQDKIRKKASIDASTISRGSPDSANKNKQMDMQSRIINSMLDSDDDSKVLKRSSSRKKYEEISEKKLSTPQDRAINLSNKRKLSETQKQETPKSGLQSQLNVAIRNELWLQNRNEKVAARKNVKDASQLDGCTFKPHFETKNHFKSQAISTSSYESGNRSNSHSRFSNADMDIIKYSNSYSKISEVKARSQSRNRSQACISNSINEKISEDNIKLSDNKGKYAHSEKRPPIMKKKDLYSSQHE